VVPLWFRSYQREKYCRHFIETKQNKTNNEKTSITRTQYEKSDEKSK
jgi:hypothetical protein